MKSTASGAFDVNLTPQALFDTNADALLSRLAIDKNFRGDLEATSKGEMLSARTAVEGSAGYVAIERVQGTLHGRTGSFVLQHMGVMTRGTPELRVTVVPDSGTDELTGLSGTMVIDMSEGRHLYTFEYALNS
jgi:Protein of unknown function (DUF3224)